ncbi:MAG: hypothetical protein N3F09_10720 [Bacteroidia bacterium]|nr:hypothetical protein [Bacteroidia bacterium]
MSSLKGQEDTMHYNSFNDLLPGKRYEIKTVYNSTYQLVLKSINKNYLVFYLNNDTDTLRIHKKEVLKIVPATSPVKNRLVQRRPYYSITHVFTENALGMDSVSVLGYHWHYGLLNDYHIKINSSWSVHSYVLVILPMSVGVRYGKKLFDKHHIGFNFNVFHFRDSSERIIFPALGNLSFRYTYGNLSHHFSVGALCFYFNREFLALFKRSSLNTSYTFKLNPGLYAGATERIHHRWVLNFESLYFLDSWGYLSVGVRYIMKRNHVIQLAFVGFYQSVIQVQSAGSLRSNPFVILPYLSYSFFPFR